MRWWFLPAVVHAFVVPRGAGPLSKRGAQESDLSELSRRELEELVRALRADNEALRRRAPRDPVTNAFDLDEASVFAGFAFESYNAPLGARWERGADGCDVAFSSARFVRACYRGAIVARVVEARGLPDQRDLSEVALTGGKSDPYVRLAVIESSRSDEYLTKRAGNATDVARTTTIWRKGENEVVRWPEDETYCLFVRDPSIARLAITVMDEDVQEDDVLGAAELELESIARREGAWRGAVDLKADSESQMFDTGAGLAGAAAAAIAGAATAGVAAVAIAAAAAAAKAKERRGSLEIELEYFPFDTDADVARLAPSLANTTTTTTTKGASPGVDWSLLGVRREYEPLFFVDHRRTGTQAGAWRDASRRTLLVAFRGTSEPRDIVTDASAAMTPFARAADRQTDGYESVPFAVGDPRVHAGFRGALDSISQRLKQLLKLAGDDDKDEPWHLELTGHSLGGALATLFALDVADGVDPDRALPIRARVGRPWFFDILGAQEATPPNVDLVRLASLTLITFGAPRAGDLAFSRALDARVPNHFRVVNGQDVVARLPRGFAYAHAGRTVLVNEGPEETSLWVEGQDMGECPLKLADSARSFVSSPLEKGSALMSIIDKSSSYDDEDNNTAAAAWNPFATTFDVARRFRDLALDEISKSPAQLAALAGVDPTYADIELKLLAALSSGDAIKHHLEPAYFAAMTRATSESPPDLRKTPALPPFD